MDGQDENLSLSHVEVEALRTNHLIYKCLCINLWHYNNFTKQDILMLHHSLSSWSSVLSCSSFRGLTVLQKNTVNYSVIIYKHYDNFIMVNRLTCNIVWKMEIFTESSFFISRSKCCLCKNVLKLNLLNWREAVWIFFFTLSSNIWFCFLSGCLQIYSVFTFCCFTRLRINTMK